VSTVDEVLKLALTKPLVPSTWTDPNDAAKKTVTPEEKPADGDGSVVTH
jgi:hypothetical protein